MRIYNWDAENRLTSIEIRTNVITDSTLWQRVTCDYDYQHRRVRKQVYRWNPGASQYLLSSSLRFLYDGWNLIGQVDEVTGMRMTFLWGADLSGSLQGAGGVGGLKAIVMHNGSLAGAYFCQYDANGNVLALVHATLTDSNGNVVADGTAVQTSCSDPSANWASAIKAWDKIAGTKIGQP